MPPSKRTPENKSLSKRKPPISGSRKADTIFPVGRINRMIRQGRYAERIGNSAGVFMAAVLEYITAELLEAAGNLCLESKKAII